MVRAFTRGMMDGRHLVGDRGTCPHFFSGLNKNHIFQYLFAFYGHFYWTYPDHMFSLSTHIQIF